MLVTGSVNIEAKVVTFSFSFLQHIRNTNRKNEIPKKIKPSFFILL
jgi:hypothetical protein